MQDKKFKILYLAGMFAGSVVRGIYTIPQRRDRIVEDRPAGRLEWLMMMLWGVGAQFIPLLYVLTRRLDFADYRLSKKAEARAGWVGAVTFAFGLWLLWRSHADLGRNWSPTVQIKEDQTLVTNGVYRYIRHPMYAAHGLWGIAQALLLQNWVAGLSSLAPFIPLYLIRVPREEQMMLDQFGEEYSSYMNRTGRVIPRIWR